MNKETGSTNTIIVKSKKNYISIVITVLILLIFIYKADGIYENFLLADIKTKFFDVLFFLISIYFTYQLLWAFFGKTTFIIADKKLVMKSDILLIARTKIYDISKIQNIMIEHNIKSNDYWGFPGFRFYDYTDILSFTYDKKKISLGSNLEKFDIAHLKSLIK
ncbi:MAG: hypothetical protein H7289_12735 [Mucilaginibacter sp.]|nr:hypothetical protein [Mucilaginibacter sp.]